MGFGHADLVIAVPRFWVDVDTMHDLAAVAAALYRNGLARRRALAPAEASRGGWLARSRAETASFANYPETLAAAEETPGR